MFKKNIKEAVLNYIQLNSRMQQNVEELSQFLQVPSDG